MSFRIHTQSPELKRALESKLAELEGQLDEGLEYEISVEILPREQALEAADRVAKQIGAESIFVAAGVFENETRREKIHERVPAETPTETSSLRADEVRTAEGPSTSLRAGSSATQTDTDEPRLISLTTGSYATQAPEVLETTPVQEVRSPRIDTQKIRDAVASKVSRARATFKRAEEQTSAALKIAGGRTIRFLRHAEAWASQIASVAKVAGGEIRSRVAAKSAQWKTQFAEWSVQQQERRRIESEACQERQRAAHREAELAAISAQIMLEQHKLEEKTRRAVEAPPRKVESKSVFQPRLQKLRHEERDRWPVWRNAFVAAACIALVGVFLLASGSKQTSASPAASTKLSQPAVVAPEHSVEQPKPQTILPQAVAQVPLKAAPKPTARKHDASVANDDANGFQEVTVRNYEIAPPKKNDKGVVQITDME